MARTTTITQIHDLYFDAQEGYQYRAVCPALNKTYEPISVRPNKARKKAREWMKKHGTRTILQRRKIKWTKRKKMHGCHENHIIKILGEWENYRIYTPEHPKGIWATHKEASNDILPQQRILEQ